MNSISLLTIQPDPHYRNARAVVRRVAALLGFERLQQVRLAAGVAEIGYRLPIAPEAVTIALQVVKRERPFFLITLALADEAAAAILGGGQGGGSEAPGPAAQLLAAGKRFFDRLQIVPAAGGSIAVRMEIALPAPLGEEAWAGLPDRVAALSDALPSATPRQQHDDLLYVLESLQRREEALHNLNQELESTNHGVLALYSEMDERAIHFHFLADAGRILASSLDFDKTLGEVARLAVPNLADWCALDLVKEGEGLVRVAVAHREPEKEELIRRLPAHRATTRRLPWNLATVLADGHSQLFAELSPGLEEVEAGVTYRAFLKEIGIRSLMVVPLRVHDRVLGTLTLATGPSDRRLGRDDLQLAEELASLAALAVDNTRLYQEASRLNEDLEARVAARTAALKKANARLEAEIQVRLQAEAQLRTRTEQLEAMGQMGQSVAATLDLRLVLERVLAELSALLPGEGWLVWLLEDGRLQLKAGRGPAADLVCSDLAADRLLQPIIQQGEAVDVADLAGVLDGDHLPVRSLLAAPLLWQERPLGVLVVVNTQPDAFSAGDRYLLEAAASWTAIALQNARLYGEVRSSRGQLRKLSQQLVVAQEEERQRLARELHDEAGQALTALKLNLSLLQSDVPGELAGLREGLAGGIELTDQTMEQLRMVAHALRPPSLDKLGLDATLKGLCRTFASRSGLEIDYRGQPVEALPDASQISLYRFVQEALTNVGKHAGAERVKVVLEQRNRSILLSVRDDGRGFDLEQVLNNHDESGIGLVGMRERIDLLGGSLTIDSRPGEGTHLQAEVPL